MYAVMPEPSNSSSNRVLPVYKAKISSLFAENGKDVSHHYRKGVDVGQRGKHSVHL